MNNFLLIIAAVLVLVFTALFAVPPMINWNDFRGAFEEEASRLLDREVRVRGDVAVRILPVPYVSFEKVRIADAPGIAGSFASADQFKLWLAVPPLLRGVFEARKIELERPVLRLRTEHDGSGNWRKLQISKGNLAYIPANVAPSSVRITDGTILFEAPNGDEITKLGNISGEMTAGALTGPYKFTGTIPFGKTDEVLPDEVRLSTAPIDENGHVRFNGSVRSADNTQAHTINGTLFDLLGKARAEGRLTSRSAERQAGKAIRRPSPDYEMTADVKLDAAALRLDKIAVSFQNKDRQQTLTGRAVTSWREGVVTETNLTAGWLDLDAIAGTAANEGPLQAVERLLGDGIGVFGAGVTRVNIAIDQANLAGASVSGIDGRLVRRDGVTKVEALRASLPGRSSLGLDGFLESRPAGLQFDGNLLLRSASFAELAEWLQRGSGAGLQPALKSRLATSFALSGNIRVRPKSILLSDATARLGKASAEGGIGIDWSARPQLNANIEADTLALENFGSNLLAPSGIASLLGLPDAAKDTAPGQSVDKFAWARGMDATLSLRANRVSDGTRNVSNVDVDFARKGGDLQINKFNLTWEPGLELALSGQLSGLPGEPHGRVAGTIAAATTSAGENLASLISLGAGGDIPGQALSRRTPLRVAVDVNLGAGATGEPTTAPNPSSKIVADGTLGQDRIRIEASTIGRLGSWREQPAQIDARITGVDALTTARWLLGPPLGKAAAHASVANEAPNPSPGTAATVVMTAAGTPAHSMKMFLRMAAGDLLDADLSGALRLVGNAGAPIRADWSGNLDIRQAAAATLARLTWPALHGHVPGAPVRGRIAIKRTAAGYNLEPQQLRIGAMSVDGGVQLTTATGTALADLTGTLSLSEASMPALSSLLLRAPANHEPRESQPEGGAGEASGTSAENRASVWPGTPFDFDHLAGVTSDIGLQIGSLTWGMPDGTLSGVALRVATSPSGVRVSNFSARLGPASLTGAIHFERSTGGARVIADFSGTGLALGRWSPDLERTNRLGGTATIELKLEGEALSPRSLSTLIRGTGTVRLKDAIVPGVTTDGVTAAARDVIDGKAELDALPGRLATLAETGAVRLGSPALKLRIANGRVAFPSIVFQQDEGGLRNATFVDLRRWQIDSQWMVTPARQPRQDAPGETVPLPAVTIAYEGPLAQSREISPKINSGDLERELVVRQMEANVARLERLRREDEARAAAERERQLRIEKEQRRSIEEENRRRQPAPVGQPARPPQPASASPTAGQAHRRPNAGAPVSQ